MIESEKVIKGIAHHKLGQCDMSGKMCPYWGKSADCVGTLLGDALSILKEQEKRIDELEEKLRLMEYGNQDILQSGMMPAT